MVAKEGIKKNNTPSWCLFHNPRPMMCIMYIHICATHTPAVVLYFCILVYETMLVGEMCQVWITPHLLRNDFFAIVCRSVANLTFGFIKSFSAWIQYKSCPTATSVIMLSLWSTRWEVTCKGLCTNHSKDAFQHHRRDPDSAKVKEFILSHTSTAFS